MTTFGFVVISNIKWTTILTAALLHFGLWHAIVFGGTKAAIVEENDLAADQFFSHALLEGVSDRLDTSQAHLLHIASVALIVAVKAASELRGVHGNKTGESEEGKLQQLIIRIREGFRAKQRQASFYNDLADQVYNQLNSLQAVTSEQFERKILEIAQRPEGDKDAVLVGASELSSGQALVKQRKDWATIEPEWEEALKKHDHDQTKLLAAKFYFVLWVVNKLDWDGVRRAKYFSELLKDDENNNDVSHDENEESKLRFSVFLADLFSTRVLARMERELLPKVLGIGTSSCMELEKFAVRTSLGPFIQRQPILWRKIVHFEFSLENRGPAVRFMDENKETGWKAYDLLDGLDGAMFELLSKKYFLKSYMELAHSIREEMARWKLQKVGGGGEQAGHKVMLTMEALLERTAMEMESPLMQKLFKYLSKNRKSKSEVKQILAFYARFFHNLAVYAIHNGENGIALYQLTVWLRAMQTKLVDRFANILIEQLGSWLENVRGQLVENAKRELNELLSEYRSLYTLDRETTVKMEMLAEAYSEGKAKMRFVNNGKVSEEEHAKFAIRMSVRPFIAQKQQKRLDFECGPRNALSKCVQFVDEHVNFVQLIQKLPVGNSSNNENDLCNGTEGGNANKWCAALKAIDAEFAKWKGMGLADQLRRKLLNGIGEPFKHKAKSPHSNPPELPIEHNKKHEALENNLESLALFASYYERVAQLLMNSSREAAAIEKLKEKLDGPVNNALKKSAM